MNTNKTIFKQNGMLDILGVLQFRNCVCSYRDLGKNLRFTMALEQIAIVNQRYCKKAFTFGISYFLRPLC